MKKPKIARAMRTKVYVKINSEENYVLFSGIEFAEFIRYLPQPMENLMLIMGGSSLIMAETNLERGLELFEGPDLIGKLSKRDLYNLGNFCFVDYGYVGKTSDLSEEQIAELLYLGHMFQPLKSPFFEPLQNRFAYLAHDDGWGCKLYCRNLNDFIPVLLGKIMARAQVSVSTYPELINNNLLQLATTGLLIDLEEAICVKEKSVEIKLYTIGDYSNIDHILNNFEKIKANASHVNFLRFKDMEYTIS